MSNLAERRRVQRDRKRPSPAGGGLNITTNVSEFLKQFEQKMIIAATGNRQLMDGTMGPVYAICDAEDIVFGVWPDATKPTGFEMKAIKGDAVMKFVLATGVAQSFGFSAIPCTCHDQAEALRRVLLDRRDPKALH